MQSTDNSGQPLSDEPNWTYTVTRDERDSCPICLKTLADILPPSTTLSAHIAYHMEVIASWTLPSSPPTSLDLIIATMTLQGMLESLLDSDTYAANVFVRGILKELHVDILDRTMRDKAKAMPVLDRMITSTNVLRKTSHSMEQCINEGPQEWEGESWDKMQKQVDEGLQDLRALAEHELRPLLTSRAAKQQRLLKSTGELDLAEYRPSTPFNQGARSHNIDSDEETKEKRYVSR